MDNYELMVIFSSDLKDSQVLEQISILKNKIKDLKGEVTKEDFWGLKDFAYVIKKQIKGYYHVVEMSFPKTAVAELKSWLGNREKEVLRSLLILKE